MSDPKVAVCTVGLGGWHPRGVARLINEMHLKCNGIKVVAWVDTLPPGAPQHDRGDITAYCAKPYAMMECWRAGADVVIWADASVYPIRHIQPMLTYIGEVGYFFQRNGWTVGQWSTDAALEYFQVTRDQAMQMQDRAGGCLGLDFRLPVCRDFLKCWLAAVPTFPGPHSNIGAPPEHNYRNHVGFCSADPRVLGHRHDQAALSIIAHQLGMTACVERPSLVTYVGDREQEDTVFVIRGGM